MIINLSHINRWHTGDIAQKQNTQYFIDKLHEFRKGHRIFTTMIN